MTDKIYIGSTVKKLCQRMDAHRTNHKYNGPISSKIILEYPDHYIELVESYPCNSKEELNAREGLWIRKNPTCINIRVAGRLKDESNKVGRDKRKEQTKIYNKKYYQLKKTISTLQTDEEVLHQTSLDCAELMAQILL
jgi:hypothetical protein